MGENRYENPRRRYQHRIGGVVYRTETDARYTVIETPYFACYETDAAQHDAEHLFRQVGGDQLTLPPLAPAIRQQLAHHFRIGDSVLYRAPEVYAWLDACLAAPESARIHLRASGRDLRIYDFKRNRFAHFFMSAETAPNSLRITTTHHLFHVFMPNFNALMIHGGGMICDGRAAVFIAPSGGGKTTMTGLGVRSQTLSDERIVLRRHGMRFVAYSTPFGQIPGNPQRAELGGIFVLHKGDSFALTPTSQLAAMQLIWTEHQHNWELMPIMLRRNAFELLAAACACVPVYRLQFQKHTVDWEAITSACQPQSPP